MCCQMPCSCVYLITVLKLPHFTSTAEVTIWNDYISYIRFYISSGLHGQSVLVKLWPLKIGVTLIGLGQKYNIKQSFFQNSPVPSFWKVIYCTVQNWCSVCGWTIITTTDQKVLFLVIASRFAKPNKSGCWRVGFLWAKTILMWDG